VWGIRRAERAGPGAVLRIGTATPPLHAASNDGFTKDGLVGELLGPAASGDIRILPLERPSSVADFCDSRWRFRGRWLAADPSVSNADWTWLPRPS